LLDRRVKGIEIGMQDRRPPEWRRFHTWHRSRTYVRFPGEAQGGGILDQPALSRKLMMLVVFW
jgi:hypothetical protein